MAKKTALGRAPDDVKDEPAKEPVTRIGIPIDPATDGIAWDRMRDSSKDDLFNRLRRDPVVAQALDRPMPLPGADPTAKGEIFTAEWAAMIFELLGAVQAQLVVQWMGVTPDQAAIMKYTDRERGIVTGPLTAVLNKWVGRHLDGPEAMLVGALVAVNLPKFMALRSLQVVESSKVDISPRSDEQEAPSSKVARPEFG